MAKKKGKKKKKNKNDIADVISKAIGNLARKSSKKLIKSFEKRTGNLAATIMPGNLLASALSNTGKDQIKEAK